MPATPFLQIGTAVINQRTSYGDEEDSSRPLNGLPSEDDPGMPAKSRPQPANKMAANQLDKQGSEKQNREQQAQSERYRANSDPGPGLADAVGHVQGGDH